MLAERMAAGLGLPVSFIQSIRRTASHEYKTYSISKRGGGTRTIHHPSKRLKALQRWLLANVLRELPIHTAAMAYRRGRSILTNADAHVESRYLLRMDLADFFPSISASDITAYVDANEARFNGWTEDDIGLFCGLVCRHSVLTIGAPTSPALSNALCYDLDVALHTIACKNGVAYTRYADDLFFSTSRPNVLKVVQGDIETAITALKLPANLKVNPNKTRHSSRRGARRVTGIVLGSDGNVYVGRALKRRIRALIHKYDTLDAETKRSLRGMIGYATGLDPQFKNSLITKYGLNAIRRSLGLP